MICLVLFGAWVEKQWQIHVICLRMYSENSVYGSHCSATFIWPSSWSFVNNLIIQPGISMFIGIWVYGGFFFFFLSVEEEHHLVLYLFTINLSLKFKLLLGIWFPGMKTKWPSGVYSEAGWVKPKGCLVFKKCVLRF